MSVLTIAVFSARSADIARSAASVFMEKPLDVRLRGRGEGFLQNSAGFVGCCLGLGRWTAPTEAGGWRNAVLRHHAFLRGSRRRSKARRRSGLIGRSVV